MKTFVATTLFIPFAILIGGCQQGEWYERCERLGFDEDTNFANTVWGSGTPLFTEQTRELGINQMHDLRDISYYYDSIVGGGAALNDFDGDGDLDLVVSGGEADTGYFINRGSEGFVECAGPAGVALGSDWTIGLSTADIDNDGDQDLLLLNNGPNRLLRNRGDGSFEDITAVSTLAGNE